jgi:hypothetical protein
LPQLETWSNGFDPKANTWKLEGWEMACGVCVGQKQSPVATTSKQRQTYTHSHAHPRFATMIGNRNPGEEDVLTIWLPAPK